MKRNHQLESKSAPNNSSLYGYAGAKVPYQRLAFVPRTVPDFIEVQPLGIWRRLALLVLLLGLTVALFYRQFEELSRSQTQAATAAVEKPR